MQKSGKSRIACPISSPIEPERAGQTGLASSQRWLNRWRHRVLSGKLTNVNEPSLKANPRFPIARAARAEFTFASFLFFAALIYAALRPGAFSNTLAILLGMVWLGLAMFFRDPARRTPGDPGLVISAADGQVVEIVRLNEPVFLEGPALKIGVFMQLNDVHVNRAPTAGEVKYKQHVPGEFLQAFRPEAASRNEHYFTGLETPHGRLLVKQIAGILARRIVCSVAQDQSLATGERLGMIKFGSRVDVFMPPNFEPLVEIGDRVRAGETPIARIASAKG
ncbi:MAG: phosphatidylserine decarboxylase [Anaerolineales bacterium]|nr:MAG: phosphatidylserine decarboxylase [Anaerolineales bacterium]